MAAEEEAYEVAAVVLDTGGGVLKAGFSTESEPRAVFQSFVGRRKKKAANRGADAEPAEAAGASAGAGCGAGAGGDGGGDASDEDASEEAEHLVFGTDAEADRDELLLSYPLEHGRVRSWDDLEAMWQYTFSYLGVEADEYNTFATTPSSASNDEKEQLAQLLFEKFDVPGLYLHPSSVLALYSVGHTTGMVLDAGASATRVVPVYEGYEIEAAAASLPFGGRDLTHHFTRMLTERGYYMDTTAKEDVARVMKESLCYVANDFSAAMDVPDEESETKSFELPDGTSYKLGKECFRLPEAMFQPELMGYECAGAGNALIESINKCDIDLRRSFYKRIIVAGGSSLFPGFVDRLQHDVQSKSLHGVSVKVSHTERPELAVWQGAAILCGLSTFDNMWITAAEFLEHGPSIVRRKG